MTKQQIDDFLANITEIYNTRPKNKFEYEIWQKAFTNIDGRVAEKMLELHMYASDKAPKIANLLEHKEEAYNTLKEFLDSVNKTVECKQCNGTGVVFVELDNYERGFRCTCKNGEQRGYMQIITNELIKDNGLKKEYNGTWKKNIIGNSVISDYYMNKVKGMVARNESETRKKETEIKSIQEVLR